MVVAGRIESKIDGVVMKHHSLKKNRRRRKKKLRIIPASAGVQTLTTTDQIVRALMSAILSGAGGSLTRARLTTGGYRGFTRAMRLLAVDLMVGDVLPIPVRWDAAAPWPSGLGLLKAYGRYPMGGKHGRWREETN